MSSYQNNSPGATYQTIVIALVAAGIIGTGIMSVIWRRRSNRRWREMRRRLPAGGDARVGTGRGIGGWGSEPLGRAEGGAGEIGLGKRPGIWEVVLGKGTAGGWREGGGRPESLVIEKEKEDEEEVDFGGFMSSGWKPTTLAITETTPSSPTANTVPALPTLPLPKPKHPPLPPPPPPPAKSYAAEMTVLIAMPDPTAGPSDYARRFSPQSLSPSAGKPSAFDPDPDLDPFDPLYTYMSRSVRHPARDDRHAEQDEGGEGEEEEAEPLPPLSIGTTIIPISSHSSLHPTSHGDVSARDLEALVDAAERASAGLSPLRLEPRFGAWARPSPTTATAPPPVTVPAAPSASARYALIRTGALAGFGGPTRGNGRGRNAAVVASTEGS